MIHALRYEPRGQRQRFEPRSQLIFLPAMPIVAIIVAIGPLVELLRSRGRMQAQPKDASPL